MSKVYRRKVQKGGVITIPKQLLKSLQWDSNTKLVIESTMVCDEQGEYRGFIVAKASDIDSKGGSASEKD